MNAPPSMTTPTTGQLVLSYLGLRRAVGVIGIALPFVLVVGKLILDGPGLPGSISAYYYTDMRNTFVGALCAIAVFLLCYRYAWLDTIAGTVGGIAAFGVAMFPTSPADATGVERAVGVAHLVFAAVFFLTLAFFSLVLFTRSDGQPTRRKMARNVVYRVSGTLIIVCLVLAVLADNVLSKAMVDALHPVFWLESIAVIAFGVSWLVKGETILADRS